MADFEVRIDSLMHSAHQFDHISREVREVSDEVRRVLNNTSRSITMRMAFHLQRALVCVNINNSAADCKSLSHGLDQAARLYREGEQRVMNAELFDKVFRLGGLIGYFDWWRIPVIRPVFPKPVFPVLIDIIRPWGPFTPIPPRPWTPTPPPFKPGFWYVPWNRPPRPRPWIQIRPNPWIRPWGPVPIRPHVPTRPRYPDWMIVKPKVQYVVNPFTQVFGPGGQNPFKVTVGALAVSPLIKANIASVGAAVRMA